MDSLIETFHLDVKLLLAQLLNFGVAFSVLYFFGLKPLFKVWRQRSDKIAKGLADGQEAEKKLARTEEDYKKEIARAKKEAGEIVARISAQAEEQKKETIASAKEEIAQIIYQEKAKIASERSRVLQEIKSEVADLVIDSVEKIIGERTDIKFNDAIIGGSLKEKK